MSDSRTVDAVVIMHRGRLVGSLGHAALTDGQGSLEERYLELTAGQAP